MSDSMPLLMKRGQARATALGLAQLRTAIGVAAWVAPELALSPWIGKTEASTTGSRLLARSLGSRDVALGLGALLAMRHEAPVRGWIEAGALSDAGDAAVTLMLLGRLPSKLKWGVLAMTLGAVAVGAIVAPCVDREDGGDDEWGDTRDDDRGYDGDGGKDGEESPMEASDAG